MQLSEICGKLALKVRAGKVDPGREVTGGCASDLLSHVMGSAKPGNVWVTIQVHPNLVGVAELLDLAAVVVASGLEPEAVTLEKAEQRGVVILTSPETTFAVAGRLYRLGVR